MKYEPIYNENSDELINDIREYIGKTNNDITNIDTLDICHLLGKIDNLNNIINELEKSAKEIVRVGKNKGYQYVENLNELKTKEEIYNFIEFYYGLYLLEQLDKLKELKEGK